MREIGHFIGGKRVAGTSGRFSDVYNPATGEVEAKVALASGAELNAAIENAKAAQPAWGATNPQRRARVLMKFVGLLHRDMDKLAEALSRDMHVDPVEIEDALWITREDLADVFADTHPVIRRPRSGAIAQVLMKNWLAGTLP